MEQRQAEKETELQSEVATAEAQKVATAEEKKAMDLSERDKKRKTDRQLALLATEQQQLAEENQSLLNAEAQLQRDEAELAVMIKDMQKQHEVLQQQAQETQERRTEMNLRSQQVQDSVATHTEVAHALAAAEAKRQDEHNQAALREYETQQQLAQHANQDEVTVTPSVPEQSPGLLGGDSVTDTDVEMKSSRIIFAPEENIEKSVVEDDLLTDVSKKVNLHYKKISLIYFIVCYVVSSLHVSLLQSTFNFRSISLCCSLLLLNF